MAKHRHTAGKVLLTAGLFAGAAAAAYYYFGVKQRYSADYAEEPDDDFDTFCEPEHTYVPLRDEDEAPGAFCASCADAGQADADASKPDETAATDKAATGNTEEAGFRPGLHAEAVNIPIDGGDSEAAESASSETAETGEGSEPEESFFTEG